MFLPGKPPPKNPDALLWFVCAPFVEELTWRAILQNELALYLPGGVPFSRANIISSGAFAGAHLAVNISLMSALTFFPSLLFGLLWTKFRSTILCACLHLWYNLALSL